MVSVFALYSNDLSSNPAEVDSSSVKILIENIKTKQKEAGIAPFKKVFTGDLKVLANWQWLWLRW